ncbi:hypothetical protein TYRP_003800 [Tyrophagus putrescentiae]|nr:hypothetical protein TYRP_003800 [Tyrophagus putrescentiae]
MKVLEAFIQARDDAFNEGPEGRLQMPRWLSGSLILLIIINIVAYVAVTWITVAHIDRQIALLQAATANGTHLGEENELPKNHLISLEEDHHTDHDSIAEKIKALESRRSELITGVIIEIALDLVDLTDVFVGNFFIHVIYLVTKLFSIGLWSYSQLEQSNSVIWLLPLCICLLIILVHLRWFTALRKWVLALCIIVSTAAWTAVLFIRCRQIGAHISRLQALNHHLKDEGDEGGEKERLKRVIEGEMQNRLILCIGHLPYDRLRVDGPNGGVLPGPAGGHRFWSSPFHWIHPLASEDHLF